LVAGVIDELGEEDSASRNEWSSSPPNVHGARVFASEWLLFKSRGRIDGIERQRDFDELAGRPNGKRMKHEGKG